MGNMTQEDKELLLKNLCARLPYGLKVKCEKYSFPVTILYSGNIDEVKFKETGGIENICTIKPYLFPLSSMTDEHRVEYYPLCDNLSIYHYEYGDIVEDIEFHDNWESIDYLNTNHFDYRHLIEKGLAIDATGKNIY